MAGWALLPLLLGREHHRHRKGLPPPPPPPPVDGVEGLELVAKTVPPPPSSSRQ